MFGDKNKSLSLKRSLFSLTIERNARITFFSARIWQLLQQMLNLGSLPFAKSDSPLVSVLNAGTFFSVFALDSSLFLPPKLTLKKNNKAN